MFKRSFFSILILCLGFGAYLSAQDCGTKMTDENLNWLRHFKKDLSSDFKKSDDIVYVPIVVHILGDDDGVGYYPMDQIMRVICELNVNYKNNTSGLQFFVHEDEGIRHHNDTDMFRHDIYDDDNYEDSFMYQTRVNNVVNLYIVQSVPGICGYFTYGADAVVLVHGCIGPDESTTTHELGHYFSLPHTFYGWEFDDNLPQSEWESVDREGPDRNCHVKADLFCDTGPDYIPERWSCGGGRIFKDRHGVEFVTDSSFFMNYSGDACHDRFSDEQVEAMQANLLLERSGHLEFTQELNTEPLIPSAMNYPAHGDTLVPNQNVLFTWENAGNAQYVFRIRAIDFEEPFSEEFITSDTEYLISVLKPYKEYAWSVTPFNDGNYCIKADSLNHFTTSRDLAMQLSNLDIVSPTCFGDANGSVSMEVTGGTAPYNYLWNDGFESNNRLDLVAGEYEVKVTDAENIEQLFTISVSQPDELKVTIQQEGNELIVYSNELSFLLDIDWSNGSTPSRLYDVNPGEEYEVTVSNAKGCSVTTSFTAIDVVAEITNVNCFGKSIGKIELMDVIGGEGPYSYEWGDGSTESTLEDLPIGKYQVKVFETDNDLFKTLFKFIISEEEEIIPEIVLDGLNAEANITGGVPPYTLFWSNGDEVIEGEKGLNLNLGGHTLTIEDAAGCIVEESFFVFPLAVTYTKEDISCDGSDDGYAFIEKPDWGGDPYTFVWDDGYEGQERFKVPKGEYEVIVTDGVDGWSGKVKVKIEELESTVMVTVDQVGNTVTCSVTGGQPPFEILWSNGSDALAVESLEQGENSIFVTDGRGCTGEHVFPFITLEYETTKIVCKGEATGAIEIKRPKGGNGPYSIIWEDGSRENTYENLESGEHELTIIDSDDVTVKYLFNIEEPEEELTASVRVDEFSKATAQVSGGWGDYEYEWSTGEETEITEGLLAGDYTLKVTDAEGCTVETEFLVTVSASLDDILRANLNIYPNPIQNNQKLIVNLGDVDYVDAPIIKIYSEDGRLVKSFAQDDRQGNVYNLDINELNAGLYFVQVIAEDINVSQKLIVF